jgi:HEAT repeat protein
MKELLASVQAYDWGKSREPFLALDAQIRNLLGHRDLLATLENGLLGILESGAKPAAKHGVCKRLGLIATTRSVPVLAAMLSDPELADMARFALEPIPSGEADTALREALPKARGLARIGIINSIGNRKDAAAVPALAALLGETGGEQARAAAWALGQIGNGDAARALAANKDKVTGRARLELLDAYLVCARTMLSHGGKDDSVRMFKELNAAGMPAPIRRAAERGLSAAAAG